MPGKMRIRVQILLALAVLPVGPALQATTLARLSLDQLAAAADNVARVRCVSSESRWENGAIWTVATFDVVETMKGNLPAQVKVSLPGGRVGHLTATVDGTPRFDVGGEAILFLERSRLGNFTVAGWIEGTFRISQDPRNHRESVTQDSSSFSVFDPATRSFLTEGIRQMPVQEFRARVFTAIARQQRKRQ